MTTPPELWFTISIGASFEEAVEWRDEASVLVPLPAGTIVEAMARKSRLSPSYELRFKSSSPAANEGQIVITDPGVVTLKLTPAQTALLTPMVLSFDLRFTFPSGFVVIKPDGVDAQLVIQFPHTR